MLPTIPSHLRPTTWLRYVDDIFTIYPHDDDKFNQFLTLLNNLVPSIKFTCEWEINKILPFLDIKIHNANSQFRFSIYRKPTHTESYIRFYSFHSHQIKVGIMAGLFLRALRLCDPEFLDTEYNHLFNTFKRLGYPHHFIMKGLSSAKRTFYIQDKKQRERINTTKF